MNLAAAAEFASVLFVCSMNPLPHPVIRRAVAQPRARRHLALLLVFAIVLAGIAQAAHYHQPNATRGSTDVHCLLCLFAASSASPPVPAQAPAVPCLRYYLAPHPASTPCPSFAPLAAYDATGPPPV
jgi:hypothetical protein